MVSIHKSIIFDESHVPVAVQIPIKEFEQIEEVMENYGLSKLMDEVQDEDALSFNEAKNYYNSLKYNVED